MKDYLTKRLKVVDALAEMDGLDAFPDMMVILMTILSACAAHRWPGDRIDRKRFIELLVRHSHSEARTDSVCVPALINLGLVTEADTLYGSSGLNTRIFRDEEIDLSLEAAQRAFSAVDRKLLKSNCYASLIYEWLRCGYAHEYSPHQFITTCQPSCKQARVSYISRRLKGQNSLKMVGFHYDYLRNLVEHHISALPELKSKRPSRWWVDEA